MKTEHLDLIPTKNMPREEWLKYQTKSIGGSSVGAVMGLSPWKSTISKWYEYVGIVERKEIINVAMETGHFSEPMVAKLWQFWDGDLDSYAKNMHNRQIVRRMRNFNYIAYNKKYPWLHMNVDRLINKAQPRPWVDDVVHESEGILECKTIDKFAKDKWEAGVPIYHYIQVQTYLLISELPYAEIALWENGRYLDVVPIEPSEPHQQLILEQTKAFWDSVLEARKRIEKAKTEEEQIQAIFDLEPAPDETPKYEEFYTEQYREKLKDIELEGSSELEKEVEQYFEHNAAEKTSKEKRQGIKNKIVKEMVENECQVLRFPNAKCTYRKDKNGKFRFHIKEIG